MAKGDLDSRRVIYSVKYTCILGLGPYDEGMPGPCEGGAAGPVLPQGHHTTPLQQTFTLSSLINSNQIRAKFSLFVSLYKIEIKYKVKSKYQV